MRILEYKVVGQRLISHGNHSGLVSGTKGYLRANFKFDESWDKCVKVASFYANNGEEYAVRLDPDDSCEIPHEVLSDASFSVSVEGRKDGYRIVSRRIGERQIRR